MPLADLLLKEMTLASKGWNLVSFFSIHGRMLKGPVLCWYVQVATANVLSDEIRCIQGGVALDYIIPEWQNFIVLLSIDSVTDKSFLYPVLQCFLGLGWVVVEM